jgi:regulator of protease activity HflC (stomatin/prohibitin superfamily)
MKKEDAIMNDTNPPSPPPDSRLPETPPDRSVSRTLGALLERLGRIRVRPPHLSRRLLFVLLAVILLLLAGRGMTRSFREVQPGFAGVVVNRFTGDIRVLPPGTHFRPRWLYELHPVRISDQLLSGAEATFSMSTKEGVPIRTSLQARWSIDRQRLARTWATLPPDPARELVAPVVASAFRTLAPSYEVARLIAEKREELAAVAARQAREKLRDAGISLHEVMIVDLGLPPEYEQGRVALVDTVQNTERMEVNLKLKAKEVEQSRLEAEAQKVRQEKMAEAAAAQRVIQARGEADAMRYVLALKGKEIEQKKLEAEADKASRVKRAEANAAVSKIESAADVERRKMAADAEAYVIRTTSLAQFENLKREAELVQANPLLIPKTFADKISDKVQVILTPTIGGEAFTGEILKRAADGLPPVGNQRTRSGSDGTSSGAR